MTTYSHSRIGTFQQCKQKYKFQYVDKIKTETPEIVETFMGKIVHEALEKLYKDLKFYKSDTKEELLEFFESEWNKNWNDKILINKKEYTVKNYKDMHLFLFNFHSNLEKYYKNMSD